MNKCLVTKFNGIVDNDSLIGIGEFTIEVNSASINELIMQFNVVKYSCNKRIVEGSDIIEPNTVRTPNNWVDIKSTETGVHKFRFYDKYAANGLIVRGDYVGFSGFAFLSSLEELNIINAKQNIDISIFSNFLNLKKLSVYAGNVTGNIANLKKLTNLSQLTLAGNVTGNIASLNSIKGLVTLELKGAHNIIITADTLPDSLRNINCEYNYNKDFGDLSKVLPDLTYFFLGRNLKIKWTSRPSSYKIIAIAESPTIDNIDKMLQDQANCQTGITSSSPEYKKVISATGTRTSASDAAVATLQSKGYTVSITPA